MAEPLNATFFTLKHRDRMVLLPATIIYAVIVLIIVAAWIGLNWGSLNWFVATFRDLPNGSTEMKDADALRMMSGMFGLFGWTILLLFPFFIATAAYEAACLRWMIRGETPGLFGIAFNNDTWRVWGVYWAWWLAQMVVGFASSLLMMPFMFMMIGEVAAQGGQPDPGAMLHMQIKMQALSMLQYIPLAFFGIRYGPAAATSVARKQFSFFEAWNVTRDRFFPLFGSYVLLWLMFGVAYGVLFAAVYAPLYGPLFQGVFESWPDVSGEVLERYRSLLFEQRTWILGGVAYAGAGVLSLCYGLLSYGINARATLAALEEGKIQAGEANG